MESSSPQAYSLIGMNSSTRTSMRSFPAIRRGGCFHENKSVYLFPGANRSTYTRCAISRLGIEPPIAFLRWKYVCKRSRKAVRASTLDRSGQGDTLGRLILRPYDCHDPAKGRPEFLRVGVQRNSLLNPSLPLAASHGVIDEIHLAAQVLRCLCQLDVGRRQCFVRAQSYGYV